MGVGGTLLSGLGAGSQAQAGDTVLWPAPGGLQRAHRCTVRRHHEDPEGGRVLGLRTVLACGASPPTGEKNVSHQRLLTKQDPSDDRESHIH